MSKTLYRSMAAIALLTIAACAQDSGQSLAPEPTKPIDTAQFFQGRWYEIGRTPMKLTDGCVAGTTDYTKQPDGTLIDRDACHMNTPEGKEETYQGPVTILNPGTNTKVSVRYAVWGFFPVWRTYWMLDHDDAYQWFIVSDPAFENVNLFTRSPRPGESQVTALTDRVRQLGYDPHRLEFPAQFPAGEQ